eukprot:XP_011428378.1 PREDICTED: uncharacterized protein LOC105328985 [Crassostrea gigas]
MFFVIFYMGLLAISKAYDNVAVNKPAYQQYPLRPGDDTYDASNAVDGRKTDLRWDGGQCAESFAGETATWWVDLTRIHSIHHITILFRTDNSGIVTVIMYLGKDSLLYHYCNEKTLRLSKNPDETLSGTEKPLRDPDVGTESTDETLRVPEVCTEGTEVKNLRDHEVGTEGNEEALRDPEVGTEGTEKTMRDPKVGT